MSDLISREEILKLPQRKGYAVNGWETYIRVSDIKELPSVQPDKDLIHLQKEQAYMQGYEDGRKLRKGKWADHLLSAQQEQLDCEDCIKNGGDWECDRVHCHKGDAISRQAAVDAVKEYFKFSPREGRQCAKAIERVPSVQPTTLTEDDKETIRIHLSAFKERLCNQRRWNEAKEYEELISRILSTASVQPQKGKWIRTRTMTHDGELYCDQCEQEHPEQKIIWNFCPNCGSYNGGKNEA